MTIKIGRFGLDVASGEVEEWNESGSVCTVSGWTAYSSEAEAVALRQQLEGYVDLADEQFVPVVWDEMPSVDGYYRVTSAAVDSSPVLTQNGIVYFTVTLERVQGFAAPMIESRSDGAVRAGSIVTVQQCKNPYGISGTGWAASSSRITFITSGSAAIQLTHTNAVPAGDAAAVVNAVLEASTTYRMSVLLTQVSGTPTGLAVFFLDSGGGPVIYSALTKIGSEWFTEFSFTTASAPAQNFYLEFDGAGAGERVRVSSIILEKTHRLTSSAAFDGASGSGYAWLGTAYASASTRTVTPSGSCIVTAPGGSNSFAAALIGGALSAPTAEGYTGVETARRAAMAGSAFAQFQVPPADAYEAAATLKMGDPLRVAVGRQIANTPTEWELSNGLVQVRPSFGTGDLIIEMRWHNGTSWSAWSAVTLFSEMPHTVTVLRNSPTAVTLRFLASKTVGVFQSQQDIPVTIDVTLRRATYHVAVQYQSAGGFMFSAESSDLSAAVPVPTLFGGGFRGAWRNATTKFFFASPTTPDPITSTKFNSEAPTVSPTGTAWHIGVGFAPTINTVGYVDEIDVYFWSGSEVQDVVAR